MRTGGAIVAGRALGRRHGVPWATGRSRQLGLRLTYDREIYTVLATQPTSSMS
jgi:hypothetical protein